MKQVYQKPVTYWCICTVQCIVYPINVVAETEHCLWVEPDKKLNWRGRELQPHRRHKRSLSTFHSFHEAKNELLQHLTRCLEQQRAVCKRTESDFERALALAPPLAAADA